MKIQELRDKSVEELTNLVIDSKKQLFDMRLQKSVNKLEDTSKISKVRKIIAQAKTVICEKQNDEVVKNA